MASFTYEGPTYLKKREVNRGDFKTPMLYNRHSFTYNKAFVSPTGQMWCNPKAKIRGRELALLLLSDSFTPALNRLKNSNFRSSVHNRALAKLDGEFNTATSLFEAWYERQQAVDMAISAAKQVLRFVREWKKPSYWNSIAQGAKQPKSLPDAWLAYNFGLKPLIGTIDHVFNTLGNEFPVFKASVTARGTHLSKIVDGDLTVFCEVDYTVKMGGRAVAYNPNTSIIGVTGLNQPLTSFLSVVPWGWAVDYFVNAGQMAQNIDSKLPGVTIDNQWTTVVSQGSYTGLVDLKRSYYYGHHKRENYPVYGDLIMINRYLGKQKYQLELSLPLLGGNQFANLTSAIALSMKGKK